MIENRSIEDDMVSGGYPGEHDIDPYVQGTEALDRPEYMYAGKLSQYKSCYENLVIPVFITCF